MNSIEREKAHDHLNRCRENKIQHLFMIKKNLFWSSHHGSCLVMGTGVSLRSRADVEFIVQQEKQTKNRSEFPLWRSG